MKNTPEDKKVVTTTTTTTVVTTVETKKLTPKETHYIIIVDESGSMNHVRQQTLDGLNEQVQTVKKIEEKFPDQKYFISIVKFDDEIVNLITDCPAKDVREFTLEDYKPRASTALRDAVGVSVSKLKGNIESRIKSGEATALVVIITDGEENSSKEYSVENIKTMITELEATGLWTFSFIGANIDSITVANSYGIAASNSINYKSSKAGTAMAFSTMSAGAYNRAVNLASGGYSNTCFMSSVANGKENIGEDASHISGILNKLNTQTASGTAGSTTANSPASNIKPVDSAAATSETKEENNAKV